MISHPLLRHCALAGFWFPTLLSAQSTPTASLPCAAPAREPAAGAPVRVPIEISNNHVLVPVCLGGRSLTFLLDTGAGASLLDLDSADSLKVVVVGGPVQALGAGPGASAGATIDGAVRVPGLAGDVPLRVAIPLRGLRLTKGRPVHGILGHDFIERYVVGIDYRNRELRLYDHASFKFSGNGVTLPVIMENNHPHIRAELSLADGGRVEGKFVIDLGSFAAVLVTKPVVERNELRRRVGATMPTGGGAGVGGAVSGNIGRVVGLNMGSVELRNVTVTLFGDSAGVFSSNALWDGNIGGDVLRRFTVYFDYPRERMILERHDRTDEAFEADMSGLRLASDTALKSIRVMYVTPGSPAEGAGIKAGDVITAIDGTAVPTSGLDALRERLRHEGQQLSITARRGENMLQLRLVTRRLI